MVLTKRMTINEVLNSNKQALKVFHKYGIDACCGGSATLKKASAKACVDVENLIEELEKAQ